MDTQYRYLNVERKGNVFCVTLKKTRFDETEVVALGEEFADLINNKGCRKLVLSLGGRVACLYSVFLSKLVMVRRLILEAGGSMKISDANLTTLGVFSACQLDKLFDFVPDQATAVDALAD